MTARPVVHGSEALFQQRIARREAGDLRFKAQGWIAPQKIDRYGSAERITQSEQVRAVRCSLLAVRFALP